MKLIQTFLALLLYVSCFSQRADGSADGTIHVPSLQSIHIDLLQRETVQFIKADGLDDGKLLPNFIRATVISNVPYLVSVMTNSEYFSSTSTQNSAMPVSVISLKDNLSNKFINLSSVAKPLLISKTGNIITEYAVDAKVNPGWNYAGGQYSTTLIFTLTPQ